MFEENDSSRLSHSGLLVPILSKLSGLLLVSILEGEDRHSFARSTEIAVQEKGNFLIPACLCFLIVWLFVVELWGFEQLLSSMPVILVHLEFPWLLCFFFFFFVIACYV